MTKLELLAEQRLKQKLYQITIKYTKLVENTNKNLEKKKEKEIKKAERQNKQRLRNQQKKQKNKERAKEGKPLLKIKVKKINWVKKCDDIFSKYIRLKYGNVCYTCGGSQTIGNGHCISRKVRKLRRDEDNCRPQCFRKCNSKVSGNGEIALFKGRLRLDGINVNELDRIELESKKTDNNKKPTEQELQTKYMVIKSMYDILECERAIKHFSGIETENRMK